MDLVDAIARAMAEQEQLVPLPVAARNTAGDRAAIPAEADALIRYWESLVCPS
jgi:hypothetical protein